MRLFEFLLAIPLARPLLRSMNKVEAPQLKREVFGLTFPNPVGLAAGFDKNGQHMKAMEALGFGFVEVGTVTPRPQAGNPRPRLFRLIPDRAVINRMGFNNEGVEALRNRLAAYQRNGMIIGGNIGKNKTTPNDQAVADYAACFESLFPLVDYFVVNVSSPNTPNLRDLQEKEPLMALLSHLQDLNQARDNPKPLLLKIAPDLTQGQLDDIIDIAEKTKLSGLIATNTTISREGLHASTSTIEQIGAGGLSGAPLRHRATEVIRYIHQQTDGQLPIIGVGGISSPEDAREKLEAGASLVQIYTGLIYEGPRLAHRINKELAR